VFSADVRLILLIIFHTGTTLYRFVFKRNNYKTFFHLNTVSRKRNHVNRIDQWFPPIDKMKYVCYYCTHVKSYNRVCIESGKIIYSAQSYAIIIVNDFAE